MVNKSVEIVTIIAIFYDEKSEMIGSKSMYTQPSNIKLNMSVSIEMFIEDDLLNL
jgi:hypothetical protein